MPSDLAVGDGTFEIIRIVRLLDIKESQKAGRLNRSPKLQADVN